MQTFDQQVLYRAGAGGYASYRIPALIMTASGTVLAFCEARKYSSSDTDQIDTYVRRSTDNGCTFGPPILVATEEDMVCGNPAPVIDQRTGRIVLPLTKNSRWTDENAIHRREGTRTAWLTYSDDDGLTWTEPREITVQVSKPEWTWYATGPGHAVQLTHGPHTGRLVVPCDHVVYGDGTRNDASYSHLIYSDDGGDTWAIGAISDKGANESILAETSSGLLYWNCRNQRTYMADLNFFFRRVAWSSDSGETASPLIRDAALPESICQASALPVVVNGEPALLFANQANPQERSQMTARLSWDEGRTWPVSRMLHSGFSAYCDLAAAPDGTFLCLYEWGDSQKYEAIVLARFNLDWLLDAL